MKSEFAWFYDVLLFAVIISYIVLGAKRGLLKSIILLAGYLVACIGGFFISKEFSPYLYDKFISERVNSMVFENIENFDATKEIRLIIDNNEYCLYISDRYIEQIVSNNENLADGLINLLKAKNIPISEKDELDIREKLSSKGILQSLKGKLNDDVYSFIEAYDKNTNNSVEKLLMRLVGDDKNSIAYELGEGVVKPVAIKVIQIILFVVSFFIIIFFVRLIAGLFKAVNSIPLAGGINKLLGGVLGFIQGIVVVYIAILIIKFIIAVTQNDLLFLNDNTIEETKFFKNLYNFKLLK